MIGAGAARAQVHARVVHACAPGALHTGAAADAMSKKLGAQRTSLCITEHLKGGGREGRGSIINKEREVPSRQSVQRARSDVHVRLKLNLYK